MQAFPKKRGILAVFLSDLQSEYNHTLLEGITKQANTLHYDIVTFSFFSNTNRDTPFQTGEENILSLFHKGYADGILTQRACFKAGGAAANRPDLSGIRFAVSGYWRGKP
ncbi:MAG: hypothetical protein ACLR5S_03910 [Ruminococcus sp.]